MTQIRKSDIAKIKELDLLTYFKNYGPDELIRNGRNESYYLRHHDSLKLSNGMWYWWSRGIGGKTALDYLIKVEGFTFIRRQNTIHQENQTYLFDFRKGMITKIECSIIW